MCHMCRANIDNLWFKQQTDCRQCSACKDMIVSDMYLYAVLMNSPEIMNLKYSDIFVCQECKDAIEEEITRITG